MADTWQREASKPVLPVAVDNLLRLLTDGLDANGRLHLITVPSDPTRPLAQRLLEQPTMLAEVEKSISHRDRSRLIPFVTSDHERALGQALDIPVFAPAPVHSRFGTKRGARRIFEKVGVDVPRGEEVTSRGEVLRALARLLRQPDPPARLNEAYRGLISQRARQVGEHLAAAGVMGRFAVDFVVHPQNPADPDGDWTCLAIEINLRKGGTTAPFLTMAFVTGGTYTEDDGIFRTPGGEPRCLVGVDHLEVPTGLDHAAVLESVESAGLGWDTERATGMVLHFLSALPLGMVGLTAIGRDVDQALRLRDQVAELLAAT